MSNRMNKTEFWCDSSATFHFANKEFNKVVRKINKDLGVKYLLTRPEYTTCAYKKKDSWWIICQKEQGEFNVYIDPNLNLIDKSETDKIKMCIDKLEEFGYHSEWTGNYFDAILVKIKI